MSKKTEIEVRFKDHATQKGLEILVPPGTPFSTFNKVNLADLLRKFRPSGCGTCLSGQPFNIREKFEEVVQVEIADGKLEF